MRPRYDELPLLPGTDLRHAWDVFGPDDALGTLSRVTDECRREASGLIRQGRSLNLSLPLTEPETPAFGRLPLQHEVFRTSSFSWDDRITHLDMQASTQWDGLLHVRHRDYGFYGGRQTDPEPYDKLGLQRWLEHGLVGRGVLIDVEHFLRSTATDFDPLRAVPIEPEVVLAAAEAQRVELREGDMLCLRFGWLAAWTVADPRTRQQAAATPISAGLSAGAGTARLLWDLGVAALACDNPAVEVQPGNRDDGYLHHRLLTMLGMPLGELFVLDELAEHCRTTGNWDFFFVSVPLNVPGAVGSPANATAIV